MSELFKFAECEPEFFSKEDELRRKLEEEHGINFHPNAIEQMSVFDQNSPIYRLPVISANRLIDLFGDDWEKNRGNIDRIERYIYNQRPISDTHEDHDDRMEWMAAQNQLYGGLFDTVYEDSNQLRLNNWTIIYGSLQLIEKYLQRSGSPISGVVQFYRQRMGLLVNHYRQGDTDGKIANIGSLNELGLLALRYIQSAQKKSYRNISQ